MRENNGDPTATTISFFIYWWPAMEQVCLFGYVYKNCPTII
jgi:hypothetical protein